MFHNEHRLWGLLNTSSAHDIADAFNDQQANIVGELTTAAVTSLLTHTDTANLQTALEETLNYRTVGDKLIDLLVFSQNHADNTLTTEQTYGI
jgi:hypothetical protein